MYEKKYSLIKRNKKLFEQILMQVKDKRLSSDLRLELAEFALRIATFCPTGYFYSNILEKFFVDIAQSVDIDNYDIKYQKGSCLHVMTLAYLHGGHTRVVERWLDLLDKTSKQSVVLLSQENNPIPETLIQNTKKRNGDFIVFEDNLSHIEKALKLRRLAMEYDYVVLHTHMEDPIASIAFGTEKFTRPVIFFNHADHLFWIGKTISDVVLNFRDNKSITKEYRHIKDAKKCTIPISANNVYPTKQDARMEVGIKNDEKIILISASDFKFNAICGDSIADVLDEILTRNNNLKIIILGASENKIEFKEIKQKYPNNLILKQVVPFDEYKTYLATADLVIDSYPCGGGTVLIDSINANVPYLCYQGLIGQTDVIVESRGLCISKQDLIEKTIRIFEDIEFRNNVLQNEKDILEKYSNKETWVKNLENIIIELPKTHTLRPIENTKAPCFINDYSVAINEMQNYNEEKYRAFNKVFEIPFLFTFIKFKNKARTKKFIIFKLFNIPIIQYKKTRRK